MQAASNIGVLVTSGPDTCLEECINMGDDAPNGPMCGSYTFYANETLCILWTEYCGDDTYCADVFTNNPSDTVTSYDTKFYVLMTPLLLFS